KKLHEQTGAGMLDCKRALEEANGDFEEAIAILRKKGVRVATKRAGKATREGIVWAYIHAGNQVGVLVEVNCETDFVARTEDFRRFAEEVAMQIAAMRPRWVAPEDVPEEALEREKEILREQAAAEGKPPHVVEKMVEGRLRKFYEENCLLKQPYIRDDRLTIEDLLNDLMAKTGERIQVRRFTRYQVGEEIGSE
ncbi:MAG: translation elongation factor Ts, partial [Armatimonadetes bacterium]|nr:translation elongation factor Ts [Armatimonadota bacterium]